MYCRIGIHNIYLKEFFHHISRNEYCFPGFLSPNFAGTNPRGVEITKEALTALVEDEGTKVVRIGWQRIEIKFNSYSRWVDLWREDRDEV